LLESPELDERDLAVMLDLAKERSKALGARHRRRRRRIAAGTVALTVTLALTAVIVQPIGRPAQRQASRGTHPSPAPSWRLVGDITQGSWQEQTALNGSQPQYGLVCPTATTCFMLEVGPLTTQAFTTSIEVTQDGGSTWQLLSLPAGMATSTGLDCVDATTCVAGAFDAAGNAFLVTTDDGGQTWTSLPGPSQLSSSFQFRSVSCTTATSCVAIGGASPTAGGSSEVYYSLGTTDGGQSWSDSAFPEGFVPTAIQCSASGACMASGFEQPSTPPPAPPAPQGVAGEALYSTDGGATWAAASVPSEAGPIVSVSCGTGGACTAVTFGSKINDGTASQVLTTVDGGQTWTATGGNGLPASLLQGLSCPTTSYCWAAGIQLPTESGGSPATPMDLSGLQGVIASTTDGGQTWQQAQLPADLTQSVVTSVSCPTLTTCLALDWQGASSQPGRFVLLSYSG
jgi:photosystem II stability/assembly factor-like uncharacterized protein